MSISGVMCVVSIVSLSRNKGKSNEGLIREIAEMSIILKNNTSAIDSMKHDIMASDSGYHDNRERILAQDQKIIDHDERINAQERKIASHDQMFVDLIKRVVNLENVSYGKEKR